MTFSLSGLRKKKLGAVLFCFIVSSVASATETTGNYLTLHSVLLSVKQNDFRLRQLKEQSYAFLAESEAAEYLPDPTVFAAIQSLPTDSFDVDQEPMTQFRVGLKQMFPKGEQLSIKSDMSGIQSEIQLVAIQQRWLERKKQTELAWLDAWYWHKYLNLLEQDGVFLAQIQEFIRSLYEVGAKDQSDLLGAGLELVKLNEKRIEASRNFRMFRQQLNTLSNRKLPEIQLSDTLPDLRPVGFSDFESMGVERLLSEHPRIVSLNHQIVLADKKLDLVKQDFEPTWGLELSYGLRDGQNMDGSDRADFFSAGVSVQVPLFSDGQTRHNQQAATQRTAASQIERDEALSQMRFELDNLVQQYRYTLEQRRLYETDILPTLGKQKNSALQSYESDQGDFRLVISLYLKEQGAKAMHQRLRVNEQKIVSSINFLLGLDSTEVDSGAPQA